MSSLTFSGVVSSCEMGEFTCQGYFTLVFLLKVTYASGDHFDIEC